ncbi:cob(I)yrinic acid a,c-diamide adenosyltransferase [Thermoanaerobacterium sp. CMT5567-10]|uniref:cob(I)yrinic acid a,c-diamide adenosyltransferase n=1 Tax=Thermoanaerobacterium sp. CMT5567-10 TaxID=3061989 RepID=UPI0026E027A7|nr:cob(I)yrinic acid a,c-diamide adenosyltransferase [Thermoanaerobacterium sp. CMT5567-10]WKV10089.1 cob(I)yrinic acid a,c-diamide adenosyltransferase [Thermoanaerobacterium sp. CMT5567-10]
MSVYTKTGDDGNTFLLNGDRVSKYDLRIKALGNLDELTSHLGYIKAKIKDDEIKKEIEKAQINIKMILSEIADGKSDKWHLSEDDVLAIERLIDNYQNAMQIQDKFILPGENEISALVDIARAIARRTERILIEVDKKYPLDINSKVYINRLSDYLFVLARYMEVRGKIEEKVTSIIKEQYKKVDKDLKLNLNIAKKLMEKVEKKAESMELPVAIAIVDMHGNLIAAHFMDGTLIESMNLAINKAYTSVALKMATHELSKLTQPGQPLYGINTTDNRIVVFGGGCPIKYHGKIIGGIGVSGGTVEQDIELSLYGADVFEEVIS